MAKGKPGVTYSKITVRDPKTKQLVSVTMPKAQADALRAKRAAGAAGAAGKAPAVVDPNQAATDAAIPSVYRGLVDPKGINAAVTSAINTAVKPLTDAQAAAQKQYDTNAAANQSIAQQTQTTLAQALANAASGTGVMQAQAAQQAAAMNGSNDAAAEQLRQATSGSMNPQLAALLGQAYGSASTNQNAQNVGNIVGAGLGGQMQAEWLTRAQGIAGMSQAAYQNQQSERLAAAKAALDAQIAGVKGQRADLVRKYAGDDGTFALQQQAAAASGLLDQQRLGIAQQNADTASQRAANSANNAAAARQDRLTAAQQKAVAKVQADVQKMVASTVKPTNFTTTTMVNGKPVRQTNTQHQTVAEVFGKNGGPWREAFKRLAADTVGLNPDAAARLASQWFPASIARSTPAKIIAMLNGRGVTEKMQKSIVSQFFGAEAWGRATGGRTGTDATQGGTYQPIGNRATVGDYNSQYRNQKYTVQGVRQRPGGVVLTVTKHYVVKSVVSANGKWRWTYMEDGKTKHVDLPAGDKPVWAG